MFASPVHLDVYIYILTGISFQFWTWFDWSAAYVISKQVPSLAKDMSAWAFRTIRANRDGHWEDPELAVQIVCLMTCFL